MKSKALSLILALVLVATIDLSAAQAEPFLPGGWVKASGNPIFSHGTPGAWDDQWVYAPSIILDGSIYKMWYVSYSAASPSRKIGYATSPDGVNWTRYGSVPVLSPGAAGSWDTSAVSFPTVIKDGSTYKMWYTGMNAANERRVGYATSPDGIVWTKYSSAPVLGVGVAGAWDSAHVFDPNVVKVGENNYKMWYGGENGSTNGIGYATSPDGISWTKPGTAAVLPYLGYDWDSTPYAPTVIFDGKGYHMWYSGCNYSLSGCQIGYATSPDGATWTRRQIVLPLGGTGAFDEVSADYASVLQVGSMLKMVYSGYNAGEYAIGLAAAPAPLVDTSYTWHTFYGSSNISDAAAAVAVDAEGNSYVLGTSMLSWNGPAGQAPLHAHNPGSNEDVFILKLNRAGEYLWHTFFGGLVTPLTDTFNYVNGASDIELDSSGNIFVLGSSRNSWGAPLHAHSGLADGVQGNLLVMKLSPSGGYQWHTFFEQQRDQVGGHNLALDGSGNVYVATSVKVPWQDLSLSPLHPYSGIPDGVTWNSNMLILKLNTAGTYQWHTFYGSLAVDMDDYAEDIFVDAGGNAYITGMASNWGTPLHTHSGADDIVALKLNTNGDYQWHTYYGSTKVDYARGITLDRSGYIYLSGSGRPFLGPSGQGPLHPFTDDGETAWNDDTFVLKLTPAGDYVWHTWYGSPGDEDAYSNKPVTDSLGNVYVIGAEGSEQSPHNAASWNGPDGQAPLRPFKVGSNNNFFVLKLTPAGVYQWHMFFESKSIGFDLAIDAQDNLVMDGTSRVAWNGPDGQAPLNAYLGSAYIVKYSYDLFSLTGLSQYSAAAGGAQFILTVTGKRFLNGAVVQWKGAALATTFVNSTTLTALVPANQFANPGVYAVRVINPAPEAAASTERYVLVTISGAGVTGQGIGTSDTADGTATAAASGITVTAAGSGTLVAARYNVNPGGAIGFSGSTGAYTDVHILPGSAFTSLTIFNCALNGGNRAYWWNGSSWLAASNQSYNGMTGCITITVNPSTSPSLGDLDGTPFATGFNGSRAYLPVVVR
jgi:predicted GH43/DUF377 family glycosyl hydrolase